MKKIFIFTFMVIFGLNTVNAANFNHNGRFKRYPCKPIRTYSAPLPIESLNALEKYTLNKIYRNDNPISRLERLETEAFGAVQRGNLISRYENVESALLARPKSYYSPKRSLINNLATFFAGQPTGLSPMINMAPQFQNYPYGYNTIYPTQGNGIQRFDEYSNGLFNRGYAIQDNNFGNGTSVKILD